LGKREHTPRDTISGIVKMRKKTAIELYNNRKIQARIVVWIEQEKNATIGRKEVKVGTIPNLGHPIPIRRKLVATPQSGAN
jgi:hypothetical protein